MKLRKLFESRRAFAFLIVMAIFVCAAFALRSSLSNGNESAMESKVEEARPVVYVAIGDSTGVGVGAREGGYVVRLFE
ncbi:MAG: hypothetical protein WCB68_13995, partial [Pyrinomonadaceae bacterium]